MRGDTAALAAKQAVPSVTVIICAFTEDRWSLLCSAVGSVMTQTVPPLEVIVCIDHNPDLLARAEREFESGVQAGRPPTTVVANRFEGRLGSARNTAAGIARGDVLAFLDDDARAAPNWLDRLTSPYVEDKAVVAVGGAPLPEMARRRPSWFPFEFDWVFGCAYRGLPLQRAPFPRLIGASMSVRREALGSIGGFHSDNHDDMDMCHRLARRYGSAAVVFETAAVVRHHVPASRLTWSYFWRRCFYVNRGKVAAFKNMNEAASMRAERSFAGRNLLSGVGRELVVVRSGDPSGLLRIGSMIIGTGAAAAGYLTGSWEYALAHRTGKELVVA